MDTQEGNSVDIDKNQHHIKSHTLTTVKNKAVHIKYNQIQSYMFNNFLHYKLKIQTHTL